MTADDVRDDLARRVGKVAGQAGELVAAVFAAMAPADRTRFEQLLECGACAALTVRFVADERPRTEVRLGLVDDRDGTSETLLAVDIAHYGAGGISQLGGPALQ